MQRSFHNIGVTEGSGNDLGDFMSASVIVQCGGENLPRLGSESKTTKKCGLVLSLTVRRRKKIKRNLCPRHDRSFGVWQFHSRVLRLSQTSSLDSESRSDRDCGAIRASPAFGRRR